MNQVNLIRSPAPVGCDGTRGQHRHELPNPNIEGTPNQVTTKLQHAVTEVKLAQLIESKTNPRTFFDPAAMAEMINSVKQAGIIEPLVVRPHGKLYEIVAGARRFRAAKKNKLEVVPVRVMALSDAEVQNIQLIENLQREGLHPMMEAAGYQQVLGLPGNTMDVLAEQIGKDRSYVYKRLQLLRLIKPAQEAFEQDRITIGHALRLARLQPAAQQQAFGECFDSKWVGGRRVPDTKGVASVSVAELDRIIAEQILLNLSAAPWKKDDAELVPAAGACTVCPKRTGANHELFDDIKAADRCTDPACFNSKREAFIQIKIKAAEADGAPLVRVVLNYDGGDEAKKLHALARGDFNMVEGADRNHCEHVSAAIVVGGDREVGKLIRICTEKDCKVHNRFGASSRRPLSDTERWAERRKRLDAKIELETRKAAVKLVIEKTEPAFGQIQLTMIAEALLTDYLRHDGRKDFANVLGLEVKASECEKAIRAAVPGNPTIHGFIMALVATKPYGTGYSTAAAAILSRCKIDRAAIRKKIAGPLLGKFEATKRKAKERKAAAPKKKAKATKGKK